MVIGLDLGGTNIHAGIVDSNGELHEFAVQNYTHGSYKLILQELIDLIRRMQKNCPSVTKIGLVCAGQVDSSRGILLNPVNIKGITEAPLGHDIAVATGLSVSMENDAVGAALAEGWTGLASHAKSFITVTLGTGVGTGVIFNEQVFRAGLDLGCEWGHISMAPEGLFTCGCGNPGCIETFCSATALLRLARNSGIDARSAQEVSQLADAGDSTALKVFSTFAGYLAQALYNYIIILNPEIIVLSGGLAGATHLFLSETCELLQDKFKHRPYMLPPQGVHASTFSDRAGVLGAAYLCMENRRIRV